MYGCNFFIIIFYLKIRDRSLVVIKEMQMYVGFNNRPTTGFKGKWIYVLSLLNT